MTHQIHNRGRFWLTLCAFLFLLAATAKIGVSRAASAEILPLPINVPVPETVFHSDNFAKSMAIDGDTLVVGAPWTEVNGAEKRGVAYIYTRNGDDPTGFTLLKSITGLDGAELDQFGWSVAIDGDTIVVGTAKSPTGAAYVFERNNGGANNWGEVRKLVHADTNSFTHFGRAVAIHGDTIAVAAPLGLGEVFTYLRDQGGANQWGNTQVLDTGLPDDVKFQVASFGETLVFDGDRLLISAPRLGLMAADVPPGSPALPDNFVGAVFVYVHQSGHFGLEAKLFSSDIVVNSAQIHDDAYGASLAIHGDTLFVGATVGQSNGVTAGKVFVYQRGAGTTPSLGEPGPWGEVAQLSPSDGIGGSQGVEGDEFGSALYAVDDGLFVSSIKQGPGKVYFYQNPATGLAANSSAPQALLAWSERYGFTANTSGGSEFGIPIAGSDNTILIADQGADGDRGAIYAYPKDELFAADPNATPTPTPSPTPTETPLPGEPCLPEPQADLHRLHLPMIAGTSANNQTATTASVAQPTPFAGFLAPGCVVSGPGGVKFGVVHEAITQTIALTIEITTAPTETMPAGVIDIGDYLRISSAKNKHLPIDKPFVIGVPVPVGADTDHLALAVLTDSNEDRTSDEFHWHFLDGLYDADQNLFLTPLNSVSAAGQRLVLAQHADFDLPPNGSEVQSAGTSVGFFTVDCLFFTTPSECTAETEEVVAGQLNNIYARLTSEVMGFTRFPYLRSPAGFIAMRNSPVLSLLAGFRARIEPKASPQCQGVDGYFSYALAELTICYDPAKGITEHVLYTMTHEYFHATQYGYAIIQQDDDAGIDKLWIVDGTASAAEESYFSDNEMSRSFVSRFNNMQKVDRALDVGAYGDASTEEYYAQDFFVYVGRRFGVGLGYLAPILEAGGVSNDGVFATLANQFGVPFSDIYWEFVKNQVIEHKYPLGEEPGVPCQLTKEALKDGTPVEFPAIEQVYPFDTQSAFDDLPPLTAKVIEIDFDNKASAMIHVGYEGCVGLTDVGAREACNAIARETIKMKLYLAGDSTCSDDVLETDDWVLTDLSPNERFFLVVANVKPDGDQGYFIGIE